MRATIRLLCLLTMMGLWQFPLSFSQPVAALGGPGKTEMDLGEKIRACIQALPPAGGVCDLRAIQGNQTISTNPFVGNKKPVVLLLGPATITIFATITPNSQVEIRGQGSDVTHIRLANGTNADLITNADPRDGNANISLIAFHLDGNAANQKGPSRGIYFRNVSQFRIEELLVTNALTHGIWIDEGCAYGWIRKNHIHNILVGSGILAGNGPPEASVSNIVIADNQVENTQKQNGIFVIGSSRRGNTNHIWIVNNRLQAIRDTSIEVSIGSQDVTVSGNVILLQNAPGGSSGSTGIGVRSARDVMVAGNQLTGDPAERKQEGIFVWSPPEDPSTLSNVLVAGNTSNRMGGHGIQVHTGDSVVVTGNTAHQNASGNFFVGPKTTNVRLFVNDGQ